MDWTIQEVANDEMVAATQVFPVWAKRNFAFCVSGMLRSVAMSGATCLWHARAQLGEGVFWHPVEACVYWIDILDSKLHRLAMDGAKRSWHFPGTLSAAVPCIGRGLLATFRDGVYHLDLDAETSELVQSLEENLPGNRFNDGALDTRGAFWFGSMDDREQEASGYFYRLGSGGALERFEHLGRFCITNGPAFSTDGGRVYFTDSVNRQIYSAPLDAEGRPGQPEPFALFSDADGYPDGMCTDIEGGVWVCHYGGGRVTRFLRDGRVDQVLTLPVPHVTKCAFGGPGTSTLYITTARKDLDEAQLARYPLSGGLFAAEVSYSGVPTCLFDM